MSYVETDEQQMLRKQVRDIGNKYGREYYMEKARTGGSPDELWAEVAEQGFIGVNVPEEYGGLGLDKATTCLVAENMTGQGSFHTRSVVTRADLASICCTRLKHMRPPTLSGNRFIPVIAIFRAST